MFRRWWREAPKIFFLCTVKSLACLDARRGCACGMLTKSFFCYLLAKLKFCNLFPILNS